MLNLSSNKHKLKNENVLLVWPALYRTCSTGGWEQNLVLVLGGLEPTQSTENTEFTCGSSDLEQPAGTQTVCSVCVCIITKNNGKAHMCNCSSSFRISSFGCIQCNSAEYFFFLCYLQITKSYCDSCEEGKKRGENPLLWQGEWGRGQSLFLVKFFLLFLCFLSSFLFLFSVPHYISFFLCYLQITRSYSDSCGWRGEDGEYNISWKITQQRESFTLAGRVRERRAISVSH